MAPLKSDLPYTIRRSSRARRVRVTVGGDGEVIVTLPKKAHEAAKDKGKKVDEFYCLEMLDATGICVVPGSGFGKMPEEETGACFFRTTVLAKETDEFIERYGKFHIDFMNKYN